MKIIHRGIIPSEQVYTFTCNGCLSRVEALQKDGRVTHDQRDGSAVVFTCPVCLSQVWVNIK